MKDSWIQIRCFLPIEKRFNKYFRMELETLWVTVSSIIEIICDKVNKSRDGKGKVIYAFAKV